MTVGFPIPSSYPNTLNTDDQLIYPNILMSDNKQYIVYIKRDGRVYLSRTDSAPERIEIIGGYRVEEDRIAYTNTSPDGYSLYIDSGYLHVNKRDNITVSLFKSPVGNISYMKVKNNGIFAGYDTSHNLIYTFGNTAISGTTQVVE